ncbi:MAG TPA: MFS transporter, partial [Bacillota bacterium]
VGGLVADRVSKRRLLLVTQSLAAAQSLLLAVLTATGALQVWHLYVLATWLGIANALDHPARQSFIYELVGRQAIASAVALNAALMNTSRIVGPAVGGLGITLIGFAGCFFVNALSFLGMIVALLLISGGQQQRRAPVERGGSLLRGLREGLAYARRTPAVLLVLIVLAFLGTFGYNFTTILPLIARYAVGTDPEGFGVLTGALGAGSLVAAVWMSARASPSQRQLLAGACAFSVLLIGVALSRSFFLTLALLIPLGFASVVFTTCAQALLQLEAPDHLRGRVMSIYTLLFQGSTPVGSSLIGAMAERWSVPVALGVAGLMCAAGAVVGLVYSRFKAAPSVTGQAPAPGDR